jgi:large subunit ribosomal protein L24
MKIRKGDSVRVISGKDRGKVGEVKRVLPDQNRVVVEGVNIASRHTARRNEKQASEVKKIEMPISVSNVMLVHKGEPTRVGFKVDAKGNKVRIARKSGDEI